MRITKTFGKSLAAAIVVAIASGSHAHDEAVLGSKLQLSVNLGTGKAKLSSVQSGLGVHWGTGANPAQLAATFEAYYVDAPTNRAVLTIPAPWTSISRLAHP